MILPYVEQQQLGEKFDFSVGYALTADNKLVANAPIPLYLCPA